MSDTDITKDKEVDPTPYGTEYSRSSRAGCRQCKEKIEKDVLRMSVRFKSFAFDGYQTHWFHYDCFWTDRRARNVKGTEMIIGFGEIKSEDQERIKEQIRRAQAGNSNGGGADEPKVDTLKIEISKGSTSKCQGCKAKINSGDIRLQTKVHFYHLHCFAANKKLSEGKVGAEFDGYKKLDEHQKTEVDVLFPKKEAEKPAEVEKVEVEAPVKKRKAETSKPGSAKKAKQVESDDKSKPSEEAESSKKTVEKRTRKQKVVIEDTTDHSDDDDEYKPEKKTTKKGKAGFQKTDKKPSKKRTVISDSDPDPKPSSQKEVDIL